MLTNQVNALTIIWATLKYKKKHRKEQMVMVNNLWTAPSSSTVELSHDLDSHTSGPQAPWKPTSWLPGEAWHWPLQLGGEPGSLSACVPASENLPSHSSRSPGVGLRVAGSGPPGVREPVLGDWLAAACP